MKKYWKLPESFLTQKAWQMFRLETFVQNWELARAISRTTTPTKTPLC